MSDDRSPSRGTFWSSWVGPALWFLCGGLAALAATQSTKHAPPAAQPSPLAAPPLPTAPPPVAQPNPDRESTLKQVLEILDPRSRADALRQLGREMAAQPEAGIAFAALIVNFDDRS